MSLRSSSPRPGSLLPGDRTRFPRAPRSAVLALAVCLFALSAAAPSAKAAVSAPTVKLTTTAAGATGVDYRVFFAATSGLATSSASITLTAPAGTSFANTTAVVLDLHANTRIDQCCATLSNNNTTIRIPVGAAPHGEKLEVWLKNVANPSAAVAGVHMTVSTSSDPTPVSSGTYSIVAAHGVSTSTVRLTTAAAAATGVDYRLSFTTSSTGALNGTGGSITVAAPAGTSFVNTRIVVTDALTGQNITGCCVSLSNSNATIKTPVAGSAAGDPLTVWLQNVANPSAAVAGVHMTVSTSSDPTPVASGTYSIVAAHGVSTSTVRLTTAAAAATGVDYRLSFTTSSTGALNGTGGSITVAAPAGTSFVNTRIVVTDALTGQNITGCCVSLSNSNATIKSPVAGSAAGDPLTVWLQNVANPSAAVAGVHMTVSTSSDPTPVSSGTYSIVAAHGVSTPTVQLSNSAPSATGVKYSVTFNASSTGALSGTGGSITITAPAGTSFGSSGVMVIDESADDVNVAGCCATLSNANATIKIPVAGSSASDTLQVILPTVTNPATPAAGARRLSVTTSADSLGTLSGLY